MSTIKTNNNTAVKFEVAPELTDGSKLLTDGVGEESLFRRKDIIGDIANGSIIEYGSNANGEWVRYADGLQILYGNVEASMAIPTIRGTAPAAYYFGNHFLVYPIAFPQHTGTNPPNILTASPNVEYDPTTESSATWSVMGNVGSNADRWIITSFSDTRRPFTIVRPISFLVVGRWK